MIFDIISIHQIYW